MISKLIISNSLAYNFLANLTAKRCWYSAVSSNAFYIKKKLVNCGKEINYND